MTPITGKLIFAGHLDVNADQIIGVALECEQDNLRNCKLPMYQECVVITMTEYAQLITNQKP